MAFVLLWSSGYVVGEIAVRAASPLGLLSLRFALALAVAIPLSARLIAWRRAPIARLAVIGLLFQGVQFAGIYGGLALGVPAPLSALIMLGLSPVATTILARASGMERPSRRTWILLALAVVGVGVSVAPDLGGARLGAGIVLTLIGMLGLATGTVLQKRWTAGLDSRIVVTSQLATAALVLIPITTVAGQWHLRASVDLAWSVGWLAWPLSIGSMILLVQLLRRYAASTTSMLLLLVPAATAVLSLIVLGQRLPPMSLVGMALTIGAVLPVVRQKPAASHRLGEGGVRQHPGGGSHKCVVG